MRTARKLPKEDIVAIKIYALAVLCFLITLILLSGCGKDEQISDPSIGCVSTSVYFISGALFPVNDLGVFVPVGFASSTTPNSCGQVMNGTLSSKFMTVEITNGAPKLISNTP